MDTNKAQLNPFDTYFKQSVAYFKTHVWSFAGLFIFSIILSGLVLVIMFLPALVFGVLSLNARGMTLDLYLGLVFLFLFLLIPALTYLAALFTKSYYLILEENTPAIHSFEKSFSTSGGVFKTMLLKSAVSWGYVLILSVFISLFSMLAYSAGTPFLVLALLILLPLFISALVLLMYFRFAEYVALDKGITGIDALLESYRLIRGNFMGIFGRLFVLSVVIMGISILFSVLVMPLSMMAPFSDAAEALSVFARMITNVVTQFIGGILTFAFLYSIYKDVSAKKPRPEAYNTSGKSFLYVLALLGFILLIGCFAALGIGGKYLIKGGLPQIDDYLRRYYQKSNSVNERNVNIENNFNLNVDSPQSSIPPDFMQQ